MLVKKSTSTTRSRKTKIDPANEMSQMTAIPSKEHDCCHGSFHFGMGHHCKSHDCHFSHKLMKTFYGILLVYLIIFVGALIRNQIKSFDYIGIAPMDVGARQLNISAEGKVDVVPNVSVVTVGNSLREATAEEARTKNDKSISDFVAKVKTLGIPIADIKTESPSMYPEYNYKEDGTKELIGYNLTQSVTVKVRDNVEKASQVVVIAGQVGLNTIGGIESVVDDNTDVYLDQARKEAVAKAQVKAQELAGTLGVRLDGVIFYNEYSPEVYPMYSKNMAMDMEGVGSGPTIEPGTSEVIVNVNITYKIK